VLILGDFNYPKIDWNSHTSTSSACSDAEDFLKTVEDCFYTHVQSPTRDDSVLDLILSRDPDLVLMFKCCIIWNMVTCTVHHEHEVLVNKRTVRDYCKGDYTATWRVLSDTDWNHLLSGDTESSWSSFKQLMLGLEAKAYRS